MEHTRTRAILPRILPINCAQTSNNVRPAACVLCAIRASRAIRACACFCATRGINGILNNSIFSALLRQFASRSLLVRRYWTLCGNSSVRNVCVQRCVCVYVQYILYVHVYIRSVYICSMCTLKMRMCTRVRWCSLEAINTSNVKVYPYITYDIIFVWRVVDANAVGRLRQQLRDAIPHIYPQPHKVIGHTYNSIL